MATRNIVVVGGNGFLGSSICKAFLGATSASAHASSSSSNHATPSSSGGEPLNLTVTSISPSGRPFVSPAGHQPAWSASPRMRWVAGNVLSSDPAERERLAKLLGEADAVVHTVGILLESRYKPDNSPSSSRSGSGSGSTQEIIKGVLNSWGIQSPFAYRDRNPLRSSAAPEGSRSFEGKGKEREQSLTYERMNRDAALNVAELFTADLARRALSPTSNSSSSRPPAFVYISASDIFRPIISSRYIETKRQAEQGIWNLAQTPRSPAFSSTPSTSSSSTSHPDQTATSDSAPSSPLFRPYFLRPGLMYHPHTRPLSTLPATLLDLSSAAHRLLASVPVVGQHLLPAAVLRSPAVRSASSALLGPMGLSSEASESLARLLTYPPLHVDTVAKAAVRCVLGDVEEQAGAKGVDDIRRLAGWKSFDAVEGPEEGYAAAATHAAPTQYAAPPRSTPPPSAPLAQPRPWPSQRI